MSYPSDLSDSQWNLIEHHFAPVDRRGSSRKHPQRLIINVILYVNKTGCQWHQLPSDFPPWQTVYDHFRNMYSCLRPIKRVSKPVVRCWSAPLTFLGLPRSL